MPPSSDCKSLGRSMKQVQYLQNVGQANRQMLGSFYQTTQQIQFSCPTIYVLLSTHTQKKKNSICPTSLSTTTLQTGLQKLWKSDYQSPRQRIQTYDLHIIRSFYAACAEKWYKGDFIVCKQPLRTTAMATESQSRLNVQQAEDMFAHIQLPWIRRPCHCYDMFSVCPQYLLSRPHETGTEDKTSLFRKRESYISMERDVFISKYGSYTVR